MVNLNFLNKEIGPNDKTERQWDQVTRSQPELGSVLKCLESLPRGWFFWQILLCWKNSIFILSLFSFLLVLQPKAHHIIRGEASRWVLSSKRVELPRLSLRLSCWQNAFNSNPCWGSPLWMAWEKSWSIPNLWSIWFLELLLEYEEKWVEAECFTRWHVHLTLVSKTQVWSSAIRAAGSSPGLLLRRPGSNPWWRGGGRHREGFLG